MFSAVETKGSRLQGYVAVKKLQSSGRTQALKYVFCSSVNCFNSALFLIPLLLSVKFQLIHFGQNQESVLRQNSNYKVQAETLTSRSFNMENNFTTS